jgi:hypothetical protein
VKMDIENSFKFYWIFSLIFGFALVGFMVWVIVRLLMFWGVI